MTSERMKDSATIDYPAQLDRKILSEWGIWGKEKIQWSKWQLDNKRQAASKDLEYLLKDCPERLVEALRYTYALSDLQGFAKPISRTEFEKLKAIHVAAEAYCNDVGQEGKRFLLTELYCIHETARGIEGFGEGQLVNETNDPAVWRQYVFLDFFKFSAINLLIRNTAEDIAGMPDSVFVGKMILAYFLGTGAFLEKSSLFFTQEQWNFISTKLLEITTSIEVTPEFPSVDKNVIVRAFDQLLPIVIGARKTVPVADSHHRYAILQLCEDFYRSYVSSPALADVPATDDELIQVKNLLIEIESGKEFVPAEVISQLQVLRTRAWQRYGVGWDVSQRFTAKNFASATNSTWFRWVQVECQVLGKVYDTQHASSDVRIVFEDLMPFYAVNFHPGASLFSFENVPNEDLPRLVLAHHVHNARPEVTLRKMIINKTLFWQNDKIVFNVSSSSSSPDIVRKERENCIRLGFNHYRIHARQHLKAGNQNRGIPNAINQSGIEYYLTMDDDFFCFPDFALRAHEEISRKDLDYFQSVNAYNGLYADCCLAERADAELMFNFESSFGYAHPRLFNFPRGTSTVFAFRDGRSSLTDTGGFLLDFSCEDFGQGCLSLIQRNTSVLGDAKYAKSPGEVSTDIHCIGEGVDLNGKMKQIERWNHGSAKVLFFLMIPALVKSILRAELDLFKDRQFIAVYLVYCSSFISRITTVMFMFLPFMVGNFTERFSTSLDEGFRYTGMIVVMALLNFAMFAFQIFNLQNRISFSPLRIFLLDMVTNIPATIGSLKGLFGMTPKSWAANKSRKFSSRIYYGNYILILLLVAAILIDSYLGALIHIFWTSFLILSLLVALHVLHRTFNRRNDKVRRVPFSLINKMWLWIIAGNVMATPAFFVMEITSEHDVPKLMLLTFLAFVAIHNITYSCVLYRLLKKQSLNIARIG